MFRAPLRRRKIKQCSGSINISYITGSANPWNLIMDPIPGGRLIKDPTGSASYIAIFVTIEKKTSILFYIKNIVKQDDTVASAGMMQSRESDFGNGAMSSVIA
jgi:hypothetical protein